MKVSDFRMFNPDGTLRPEFQELEESPAGAPEEDILPEPSREAPAPPGAAAPDSSVETDFVDLVQSLATSAFAAMGLLSEPGERSPADLAGARRMIDWLAVLESKTRKNLSFAEQNVLTRALYELRMAYVELTSGSNATKP